MTASDMSPIMAVITKAAKTNDRIKIWMELVSRSDYASSYSALQRCFDGKDVPQTKDGWKALLDGCGQVFAKNLIEEIDSLLAASGAQPGESETSLSAPLTKKKQKTKNVLPGQRRNSMKFTMDPLRHLKTPNVRIQKKELKMKERTKTEKKVETSSSQILARRPSMRFTLDPLRNLNYLSNDRKSTVQ